MLILDVVVVVVVVVGPFINGNHCAGTYYVEFVWVFFSFFLFCKYCSARDKRRPGVGLWADRELPDGCCCIKSRPMSSQSSLVVAVVI